MAKELAIENKISFSISNEKESKSTSDKIIEETKILIEEQDQTTVPNRNNCKDDINIITTLWTDIIDQKDKESTINLDKAKNQELIQPNKKYKKKSASTCMCNCP